MSCVVARHINGISINGYEYVLNNDKSMMIFDNPIHAVSYLIDNGATDEDIYRLKFFDYNEIKKGVFKEVN